MYVDYLTEPDESEKQAILYDAAGHYQLCWRIGAEGEEVLDLLVQAVARRGRAYEKGICHKWVEVVSGHMVLMQSQEWVNRQRALLAALNGPPEFYQAFEAKWGTE